MKVMLDEGAIMPTRAHTTDAGLDLYAMHGKVVPGYTYRIFDTGVHVEIPEGKAGQLIPKSGLMCKHGIISFGLIDEGYTGSIKVCMFNTTDVDYHVKRGEKVGQLVIFKVYKDILEQVDKLGNTERGENGFGSTGR